MKKLLNLSIPSNQKLNFKKDKFKTLFTNLKFINIEDAGHWLHVEKPQEFMKIISKKLI